MVAKKPASKRLVAKKPASKRMVAKKPASTLPLPTPEEVASFNAMVARTYAANRVQITRSRWRRVFNRRSAKTALNGLSKDDLMKNKNGKVVSKKRSHIGQTNSWIAACMAAREVLGIEGYASVKRGSELYEKAVCLHRGQSEPL